MKFERCLGIGDYARDDDFVFKGDNILYLLGHGLSNPRASDLENNDRELRHVIK